VALLARRAGMRSIVFTSKHHDGFCMFRSATTGFNVADATPYGRDVLRELADACRRHDVKLGLYFSLIDWHYPQAAPISSHNSDAITPEHFELNKRQITELLTGYGAISELWFDMGSHSFEQSLEMRQLVHRLQPDCMIGSRLGNDMSDFMVMGDNQEPTYIIGVPWQSPASFFHETWGYRSWQQRGDRAAKTREKLTSLVRVCSRGGNFLLNIGPRGDGSVVDYERDVLLDIGRWLARNGEAIYGTAPDPFHVAFDWGAVTARADRLYLHVLSRPTGADGRIVLPGLAGKIVRAGILSDGTPCRWQKTGDGIAVTLPPSVNPAEEIKVVELVFKDGYTVPPINPIRYRKGAVLDQHNAFKYYSNSGIDYNSRYRSTVRERWTLLPDVTVQLAPVLHYTDHEKGRVIELELNGRAEQITLDGDAAVPLGGDAGSLTWGPIYVLGALRSGIEGAAGDVAAIDPAHPWGRGGQAWLPAAGGNNEVFTFKGDLMQARYMLQEITASAPQQVAVRITAADAVTVWLNGTQLSQHNNPRKAAQIQDVILLDLKAGKNQLLVKCFNNFQKEVRMGIATQTPQRIYVKRLAPVRLRKGDCFAVSWKAGDAVTPHETLNLPNLRLLLP
jgi:alpha-L-fucosidase